MRLITVDNGNSNPHVGIFQDGVLSNVIPLKNYSPRPDDFILASDVGPPLPFTPTYDLKSKRHTQKHSFFFDMPVHYTETLGDDRLFFSYLLFKRFQEPSKKNILAIDAGTFITMDLIGPEGFMGGYIYPGINTFLSSYAKGSKLPVLTEKRLTINDLPHSTEEAIFSAADIYLESILLSTIKKTSPDVICITGGSLEFIKNKIEKLNLKVQLESDPHSIHLALALIFQTHLQTKDS